MSIFKLADRLVGAFLDGLQQNNANKIIHKARKAEVSKEVKDLMKRMDDDTERLRDLLKTLKK